MWLKPSLKEATELDIRTLFISQFYTGTFIYDAISVYINIFSYEFTIILSIPYRRALLFLCSVFIFSQFTAFFFFLSYCVFLDSLTMLRSNDDSRYPCLVPDSKGRPFTISLLMHLL